MGKPKSIIYGLPIEKLNLLLERLGLEKAWYSVLATNLKNSDRNDLLYILNEKEMNPRAARPRGIRGIRN